MSGAVLPFRVAFSEASALERPSEKSRGGSLLHLVPEVYSAGYLFPPAWSGSTASATPEAIF